LPAPEILVEIQVINAVGLIIVQTTWRQADRRRDRIETETVTGATALMRRLDELVRAIAGKTPDPMAAAG
jgi:hypothetical protein